MLHVPEQNIDQAIAILKQGGVIVYPTETTYGLGCDATNEAAVERIFLIKGRPDGKGLPVLVSSLEQAAKEIHFTETAEKLATTFWPGPLNIIGARTAEATIVERCGQNGSQSVRVSSHPVAAKLIEAFGAPIAATSANVSGQEALYSVEEVEDMFADRPDVPDAVIDAGTLPIVPASTTVLVDENGVKVLRQGSIDVSDFL